MSDTLPPTTTGTVVTPARSAFPRLSLMMLLQYIVFGSWYATLGLVLATNGMPQSIGIAYSLGAFAAIVSPMLLGALGDRILSSQVVLAIAHAVGGVLLFFVPGIIAAGNTGLMLAIVFVHMLFFQPTLALTNSIAFRHLGANSKLFPYIRVFGTLGWIVGGLVVGSLDLSASTGVFVVAGVASIVLAAYALTLPKTPPGARGARFSIIDVVGGRAFALFRHRNFTVLIIASLLTAISLGIYNAYSSPFLGALGVANVAGVLVIGQVSELVFIVTIPFVLAWIGMKWALLGGMAMWGVRFGLMALAAGTVTPAWAIVAIALHGICNDFFLILTAMYVDRVAPVELQAQAQSLLLLVVNGIGVAIGSLLAGAVFGATVGAHPDQDPSAWIPLFTIPIVAAVATVILWTTLFRGGGRNEEIARLDIPRSS